MKTNKLGEEDLKMQKLGLDAKDEGGESE